MAEVTKSLYRWLDYKKVLKARVDKEEKVFQTCSVLDSNDKEVRTGRSKEEVESYVKDAMNTLVTLRENYFRLCDALDEANATTKLTVAGKEYTIRGALQRQRYCDDQISRLRENVADNARLRSEVAIHNEKINNAEEVSSYVQKVLGDASKKDTKMIEELKAQYIKDRERHFHDPFGYEQKAIEELAYWEDFKADIHAAITKANSDKEITIKFAD